MNDKEFTDHGSAQRKTRTAGEAGWRLSRYNLMADIPGTDRTAVANLYKANCVVFRPEELYLLSEAENLPENHPILGLFRMHGLIVDFDEREALAKMGQEGKTENSHVTITVCTTMKCNFDCPYCFENHSGMDMPEEVQDDVAALAERMLRHFGAESLHIVWFGGEPLMNPQVIWNLTPRLRNLAERYGAKYSASIAAERRRGMLGMQVAARLRGRLPVQAGEQGKRMPAL